MTLAFDPQHAPAPTDDPSGLDLLDLVDLGDQAYNLAYESTSPEALFQNRSHLMASLMADFIGADITRYAQFVSFLAERTPAPAGEGF